MSHNIYLWSHYLQPSVINHFSSFEYKYTICLLALKINSVACNNFTYYFYSFRHISQLEVFSDTSKCGNLNEITKNFKNTDFIGKLKIFLKLVVAAIKFAGA